MEASRIARRGAAVESHHKRHDNQGRRRHGPQVVQRCQATPGMDTEGDDPAAVALRDLEAVDPLHAQYLAGLVQSNLELGRGLDAFDSDFSALLQQLDTHPGTAAAHAKRRDRMRATETSKTLGVTNARG